MSDTDKLVLDMALEEQDNRVPFQTKQYLEITDTNSTNGTFNGQINFDLQNLSSLYQHGNLSEAYIEIPVRFGIQNTGSGNQTPTPPTLAAMTVKGGWHSFINSVNINIGSTNVQSANIYQNLNTSFKILTTWDANELAKNGSQLGVEVDDFNFDADDGTSNSTVGINNISTGTAYQTKAGFTLMTDKKYNDAYEKRAYSTACDNAAGLRTDIMGTGTALGVNSAQVASGTVAQNGWAYVCYAVAQIRLKDISDCIKNMPPCKGLKGNITINYNAGKTIITSTGNGTAAVISAANFTPIYGNGMPAMTMFRGDITNTIVNTWDIIADVGGAIFSGTNLTTAVPSITNARLFVPLYVGQPSIERALNQKKSIKYLERFQTSIDVDKNGTYSGSISSGIINPRRITLYPFFTTTTSAPGSFSTIDLPSDPMLSPFTHEGFGTSPHAKLRGFNVICAGKPVFQSPVDYQFHNFTEEIATMGLNGGLSSELNSGLIDFRKWNQLYSFYTCNLERRIEGSDGQSVPVQVQFTNATNLKMRVVCEIEYEKEIIIDCQYGLVQNA